MELEWKVLDRERDKDLHMTLKTASPANVQRLGLYTYDNTHNERFQLGSQALFTNTITLS